MRRSILTVVLSLAALGLTAAATNAMVVHVNESRRIALRGVATNVIIGDPSVADVAMTDAHSVVIMGKGYGSTQLLITDAAGRTLLADDVTVTAPDNGRITFYHGMDRNEYACDGGRCHPIADGRGGSGAPGGGFGGGMASAPTSSYGSPGTVTMNLTMRTPSSAMSGAPAAASAR
jgi:hypothetical protein